MADTPYNVLFICTGNSARSIIAESLINRWGAGKFRGYSAGSHPRGEIHPLAIYELEQNGYATEGLRSKSWDEFTAPGAPRMDFVFTVCDTAAGETCPLWPGQPMTAHWGVADPAAVEGDRLTRLAAFVTAFRELQSRISIFVNLPFDSLDSLRLQEKLDEIGRTALNAPGQE
jgi:protein-tyrosine-phosphatase